jgi:hypothetical protein
MNTLRRLPSLIATLSLAAVILSPFTARSQIEPMTKAEFVRLGSKLADSANGRYRLTRRLADTGQEVIFTLSDRRTGRVLWRHPHGTLSGLDYWKQALVSDDGWSVLSDGVTNNQFVSPAGLEFAAISYTDPPAISKSERSHFVQFGSEGAISWGEKFTYMYFTRYNGRDYFCVHYWWGRRALFDLAAGRQVHIATPIKSALEQAEREFVIRRLRQAVGQIPLLTRLSDPNDSCCPGEIMNDAIMAAHMAGRMKLHECVPLLLQLESIPYSGVGTETPDMETHMGEVNPFNWDTYTFRQVVQLSLRRLGATPRLYPATQFKMDEPGPETLRPFKPKPLKQPRSERIALIHPGQRAEQVLNAIGAPDFVSNDTWDYDMDSKPPFTLRVLWSDRRVMAIKRLSPPLWQRGNTRDVDVVDD